MKEFKKPNFTHFASLPFIRNKQREAIRNIQHLITSNLVKTVDERKMRPASNLLMHLTLGMLVLPSKELQTKACQIFEKMREELEHELRLTKLTFFKLDYFTRQNRKTQEKEVNVIYLEPEKDNQLEKVKKIVDRVIRAMLEAKIVYPEDFGSMHVKFNKQTQMFEINAYHLTLFRLEEGVVENGAFKDAMEAIRKALNPLVLDCDCIDISTRFKYDQTKFYFPLTRVKLESST